MAHSNRLILGQRWPAAVKLINGETVVSPAGLILAPTILLFLVVDCPNNGWIYFHIHLAGGGRLSPDQLNYCHSVN